MKPLEFWYRNHEEIVRLRKVIPLSMWFGITPWHPKAQWLMRAQDTEKYEPTGKPVIRDFAFADMLCPKCMPASANEDQAAPPSTEDVSMLLNKVCGEIAKTPDEFLVVCSTPRTREENDMRRLRESVLSCCPGEHTYSDTCLARRKE